MDIWVSSDHHFGHVNILKYCDRPFETIKEMDETLIQNWNERVKKNDIVYYLGDFSFHPEEYVNRLNGKIMFIKGNHDRKRNAHLFESFNHRRKVQIGKFICILNHRPIKSTRERDKIEKHDYVICGHVHDNWVLNTRNINAGVDQWGFKPIHIDELRQFLNYVNTRRIGYIKKNEYNHLTFGRCPYPELSLSY